MAGSTSSCRTSACRACRGSSSPDQRADLSSVELAHAIAVRWPHVKVLLMTGYAEQKEAAEDLASIIEGVLDKPFAIGDVRRQVCEIVATAAEEAGRRSACA